ncbi:hypothetical protein JCM12298_17410 [Desulfothermus naphthae]
MDGEILNKFLSLGVPGGILTFVFGIFSGGLLISLFSMLFGKIKKIKFYEKLSIQILRMSFFSFLVYLILGILSACYLIKFSEFKFQLEQIKEFFLKNLFVQIDLTIIVASIFLFIILFLLKNLFKKSTGLYILILLIINILWWVGMYGAQIFNFYYLKNNTSLLNIKNLLLPKDMFLILIFWSYLFFSLGISSLYSTFYLMIRRNKDDFGRDYYKFSIPACAKWSYGLIFFLLSSIAMNLIYFKDFRQIPLFIWVVLGGIFVLIIVGLLLNNKLIKSVHPIRFKEIMVLNPFLGLIISILFVIKLFAVC